MDSTGGPALRCTTIWSSDSLPPIGLTRLWLTEITEHQTGEGKLYLCAVKDACSNPIVSYAMNKRMTSQLAVDAVVNACSLRRAAAITVHSDRGSQFRSHAYVRALRDHALRGSMGCVGA